MTTTSPTLKQWQSGMAKDLVLAGIRRGWIQPRQGPEPDLDRLQQAKTERRGPFADMEWHRADANWRHDGQL